MQSAVRTLLLLSATIVLGLSPLGFVSVPGFGGAITFLHLPMILAATLESPFSAALVGIAFGVMAGVRVPEIPLTYHIIARMVAGITAAVTFQAISSSAREGSQVTVASLAAAVTGTVTNTVLMCAIALGMGLSSLETLLSIAFVHGTIELAAALLVTTPLTILLGGRKG